MAKDDHYALGLVETHGLVAAIEAADAMSKAAEVKLLGVENTVAALMTVQIAGETAAVQSAVEAGVAAASRVGEVIASHVIPRPSDCVRDLIISVESDDEDSKAASSGASKESQSLSSMTVKELRAIAREAGGLSLQGREIARANKSQLIEALTARKR